jgi:hypothetical protein
MVLRALILLLAFSAPALAENRGTRIAMAVALLGVVEDHCHGRYRLDHAVKNTLFVDFHEYDIAGLASLLSRPLNAFYEDYSFEAKKGRDAFCRMAPEEARLTGYPVILAGAP